MHKIKNRKNVIKGQVIVTVILQPITCPSFSSQTTPDDSPMYYIGYSCLKALEQLRRPGLILTSNSVGYFGTKDWGRVAWWVKALLSESEGSQFEPH